MSTVARSASAEAGLATLAGPLLAALLLLAPLIKGGNRPLPLLVLELAAVALLVLVAMHPRDVVRAVPRLLIFAIIAMVALPLLQLVPLPAAWWSMLPGHETYLNALRAIGADVTADQPLSLLPRATEMAWLALLPPVAVFLTTTSLSDEALKGLVRVFVIVALFQALLGLAQYGTGSVAVLWYVEGLPERSGIGTYANRDHLAGLLEMALPLVLALFAASIHPRALRRSRHRGHSRSSKGPSLLSQDLKFNRAAVLGAASLAIVVGLVFTRSRTGVALAMLGVLLCTVAFARRIGGEKSMRFVTVFGAIALAVVLEIGLAPVLARFAQQNIAADARWSIFSGTLAGIGEFFPLGSGVGTFPEVFRRFQPGDVDHFVNHAHNDYLEWLFEGGIVAALIVLVVLAAYLRRWPQLWRTERWSQLRFLQVASGISLLLLGLHGLIDFNLHIPANAIYFAFLAGLFFHREAEREEAPRAERAARAEKRHDGPVMPIPAPAASVRNPFAE
jgi:O-antigen ligase